jgi:hypothetical protein
MIGPRPAGRPWTLTDDDMLRKLLASGMKAPAIALKMNRTVGGRALRPTRPYLQGRSSHLYAMRRSSNFRSRIVAWLYVQPEFRGAPRRSTSQ